MENLGLTNEKMLEIVKNYDEEEKANDIRPIPIKKNIKYEKMIEEMTFFLGNEDQRILCALDGFGTAAAYAVERGRNGIRCRFAGRTASLLIAARRRALFRRFARAAEQHTYNQQQCKYRKPFSL